MSDKFKMGQTVNYRPKDRMLSTARGTYEVTVKVHLGERRALSMYPEG